MLNVLDVKVEPSAFTLTGHSAVGNNDVVHVTWPDLKNAEVGKKWSAVGGGTLFDDAEHATVVFKNDSVVVVLFESHYQVSGSEADDDASLQAFKF